MAEQKNKKQNTPKVELRSEIKKNKENKPTGDEPDEFVAGVVSTADKLRPHAFKIGILVGLFVIATIGITTYQWMNKRKQKRATDAFASALKLAQAKIEDSAAEKPAPNTSPPDSMAFASRAARADAVIGALSKADALSVPTEVVRGNAFMELGRFEEAARSFSAAAKSLPLEAATAARAAVGYAYEAKAEATKDPATREQILGEALAAFRAIQTDENGVDRDASIFHEARILAVLGKRDEARATYQKLLDNYADSLLRDEVEIRLEALGGP